ncbi:Versiconal hemiacetal acetate reductase [Vanrija pseudolonga]|uniref:Versiconal hemiacetal acetate reductase n=1 Tax=Vanrija pseudolonga TaxID=143232 RepID=A0AAF0YFR4_9TREE|nr:Versiconal hemiacetal acetate reductase [Vanrija pseudolonga]
MTEAAAKMPYVRLGKSGLKVSKIILGCMSYGSSEHQAWILDEAESIKHVEYAYSRGINTFDTANVYSDGQSEVVLGKALRALNVAREAYVVLTKVYFPLGRSKTSDLNTPAHVNQHGLSRKHIFASVKASLERLGLEYVDVLQCHRFDYDTPIEETMQALHDVVQAGLARYVGMSSCHAYQFHQMQNYAITHNLTPFVSMQNFHNAAYREEEREMVPTLKIFGTGMIPWSPLMRGFLARPWAAEETTRVKTDAMYKGRGVHLPDASRKAVNEVVEAIAKQRGVSMAQVALAWSISNEFVTAPIVGSTSLDKLAELIDAVHIKLTPEEKKAIDEVYEPRSIVGHQ